MMNMKKKATAMGLATVMAVSAVGGVALAETRTTYTDVAEGEWYYAAVDTVTNDLKLMSGIDGGLFGPKNTLTREQFVQVLYNMTDKMYSGYAEGTTSKFTDVDINAWYAPALRWAEDNNVTSGTSDTTFGIGETVTREQMAQFMYNYCEQNELNPMGDKVVDSYGDADTASDWAKDAIEWARTAGLFAGDENGNFNPGDDITRAEAAQVMANFYGNSHDYRETDSVDNTAATCTEDGSQLYTCLICGDAKTVIYDAMGHLFFDGVVTKAPTCTEEGEMTYTCDRCGETKTEVIPSGHSWDEGIVTKETTCTEDGEITYTCTVCGDTKTQIVTTGGHKWDEGVVTKEATCTENGEEIFTCKVCGETKTEVIPTVGHDFQDDGKYVSTSVNDNLEISSFVTQWFRCAVCGEIETVNLRPATPEETWLGFVIEKNG